MNDVIPSVLMSQLGKNDITSGGCLHKVIKGCEVVLPKSPDFGDEVGCLSASNRPLDPHRYLGDPHIQFSVVLHLKEEPFRRY